MLDPRQYLARKNRHAADICPSICRVDDSKDEESLLAQSLNIPLGIDLVTYQMLSDDHTYCK